MAAMLTTSFTHWNSFLPVSLTLSCWRQTTVEASWNVMAHTQKSDFVFDETDESIISAGASVQSTTGSRGVGISGSNAGYTMFRGSVKSTGYPLHSPVSPSLPFPTSQCAITYQLESTAQSRSVQWGWGMILRDTDVSQGSHVQKVGESYDGPSDWPVGCVCSWALPCFWHVI